MINSAPASTPKPSSPAPIARTVFGTTSGALIDLAAPEARQIRFNDIATHLSKLARYAGATLDVMGYTVAQHSCILGEAVSRQFGPVPGMYALLHDAHEAYTGDIIEPAAAELERMLGEPFRAALANLKTRLDRVIHERLRLVWPAPDDIVRAIDEGHARLVNTEFRDCLAPQLMRARPTDAIPFALRIRVVTPAVAHEQFLNTLRTFAAWGGIALGDDWL